MRIIGRKLLFVFFLVVLAVAGTLLATPSASAQSRAAIGDTPRFFNFGANPAVSNATHRSTLVNSIPY